MSLIIFSCSPRPKKNSNTSAIVESFRDGFLSEGESDADVYYLYERKEWDNLRKAFKENTEIIFALPLFVECIPGLLMEFLESLEPKPNSAYVTKVGFILQSGFEEACQLRTCEKYLEQLPFHLNCEYSGTLIKGGMFGLSLASVSGRKKMLLPFFDMGKLYAKERVFDKTIVSKFAAPETYPKIYNILTIIFKPLNKIIWLFAAKKFGANDKLDARPYEV